MEMLGLPFDVEGVIPIAGELYATTPKALQELAEKLRSFGYTIDDLREAESAKDDGVSVQKMEQNGWSLWFAHMKDLQKGKCGSCHAYISVRAIQFHGHKCENCGAVTYYELIDGSTVKFLFVEPLGRDFWPRVLVMKVRRWDTEQGLLYLYPDLKNDDSWGELTGEKAREYLAKHGDKWEKVTEEGQELIRIHYPDSFYVDPNAVISVHDRWGHYWNHKIVKLWDGKEYSEFDRLPIPEMVNLYETWHWTPLAASPTIHERLLSAVHQVSDQGFYHQDGRSHFTHYHWQEIGKFIENFTSIDASEYNRAWPRFRSSGPGGIADLAEFCHPRSRVTNRPNIGNTLDVLGNALQGRSVSRAELEAAADGWKDPKNPFLR